MIPLARFTELPQRDVALTAGHLHVVDTGSGRHDGLHADLPPVVMVHGSPTTSALWRHQIGALASDGRRVIAPDQLGQGASSCADEGVSFVEQSAALRELIEVLGLDRFDLVVHDWGGPAGLGACADRWECIDRLVLVNTTFLPDWAAPDGWEIFTAPGAGEQIIVEQNAWPMGLPTVMRACTNDSELHRHYLDASRRIGTRRTFLRLERLEGLTDVLAPVAQLMAATPPPTRIVWGDDDVYFGQEHVRLVAACPSADLVVVDGGGHFPQEDRPEQTTEAIASWLRR